MRAAITGASLLMITLPRGLIEELLDMHKCLRFIHMQ